MAFLYDATVRKDTMLHNTLVIIKTIEENLIQKPSLTTLITTVSWSLKASLMVAKTLNFGGVKARLKLDAAHAFIEVELPALNQPRVYDEGFFLKRILNYRDYLITNIACLIMNELEFRVYYQPHIRETNIDIYSASGSRDPESWPFVLKEINNTGRHAILIDGVIRFTRFVLEGGFEELTL
jgi:hypothetical protein